VLRLPSYFETSKIKQSQTYIFFTLFGVLRKSLRDAKEKKVGNYFICYSEPQDPVKNVWKMLDPDSYTMNTH
jgi:hypothetical protein